MGYVGDITHDAATAFLRHHRNIVRYYGEKLKEVKKDINYFGNLLISNSDKVYPNPLLSSLSKCNRDNITISKLEYFDFVANDNFKFKYSSYIKNKSDVNLINVYFYGFIKSYKLRYEISQQILKSTFYISVGYDTLCYIIRRYFFQVQQLLLIGGSYTFVGVKGTIMIYGKHKSKAKYNNAQMRKVEDWGASLKFLIEQSKRLDEETYNLYKAKLIRKREFLRRLKPHLYSYDNPKGLKWIIYSEKDFDLWLILKTKISKFKPIKIYSITPTNFINNETKSQLDFTAKAKDIGEIIESELLGFRDKIRALERFDMEYCLTTFKNDSKYNKQ